LCKGCPARHGTFYTGRYTYQCRCRAPGPTVDLPECVGQGHVGRQRGDIGVDLVINYIKGFTSYKQIIKLIIIN